MTTRWIPVVIVPGEGGGECWLRKEWWWLQCCLSLSDGQGLGQGQGQGASIEVKLD